ncbi:MAG: hypothetical protein KKH98_07505 [Spirochaetes bacterium]|nr:hypothetical protein [Spirochaetota bacterium]
MGRFTQDINNGTSVSVDVDSFILELFGEKRLQLPLEIVYNLLKKRFKATRVIINFLDEKESIFKMIGSTGITASVKEGPSLEFGSYVLKTLTSPVHFSELISEPKYKEELNGYLEYDLKILFPLLYKSELRGFIALGPKDDKSTYSIEDFEELNKFGSLIGTALVHSRAVKDAYSKLDEMSCNEKTHLKLLETSKNITLAENLDEALTIFYKSVQDFFGIKAANIMIPDASGKVFKIKKSLGLSSVTDEKFVIDRDDEILGSIIQLGESMYVPEYKKISGFKSIAAQDKKKISCFYCVPIKLGSTCFGIFNIFDFVRSENDRLSSDHEKAFDYIPLGLLPYIINESK